MTDIHEGIEGRAGSLADLRTAWDEVVRLENVTKDLQIQVYLKDGMIRARDEKILELLLATPPAPRSLARYRSRQRDPEGDHES